MPNDQPQPPRPTDELRLTSVQSVDWFGIGGSGAPRASADYAVAFDVALEAIRDAHAVEITTLLDTHAQVTRILEAQAASAEARADRAEEALRLERSRADALRVKLDEARAARQAEVVAKAVLPADAPSRTVSMARQGRGRLARVLAAWRGE